MSPPPFTGRSMYQCDVNGNVTRRWKLARISDLVMSADGAVLAMLNCERHIKLARAHDPGEVSFRSSHSAAHIVGHMPWPDGTAHDPGEVSFRPSHSGAHIVGPG